MKLRRPVRRDGQESVVALIDVVFFLLIFFMLVGRLDATAPFAVTPPLGITGADLPAGGVTLSVAPDGTLALDGAPLAPSDLDAGIVPRLAASPDLLVRLNADKNTDLGHLLPLIARLEALGARDVVIIVTPQPP